MGIAIFAVRTINVPNIEMPRVASAQKGSIQNMISGLEDCQTKAGHFIALPHDDRRLLMSPPPLSVSPLSKKWVPRVESPPVSQAELVYQSLLNTQREKLEEEAGYTLDGVTYRLPCTRKGDKQPHLAAPRSMQLQRASASERDSPNIVITLCPEHH